MEISCNPQGHLTAKASKEGKLMGRQLVNV